MSAAASGIVGILLAAGRSTRFGGDKLLHPLADGSRLALASARNLRAGVSRMLAVVRPGSSELRQRFAAFGIETVICLNADEGMGASLACGVAATADAAGWVIALGDMPFIRPDTIAAVAAALARGAALAAPFYEGQRGHPVGIGAEFRDSLLKLCGDQGARAVLVSHPERLQRIDVDDRGILADVDLPPHLQAGPKLTS